VAVNADKPNLWKSDIAQSVDMYNRWFMAYAPDAFRATRSQTAADVEAGLRLTNNMTDVRSTVLWQNPEILPTLRMSTCPPLAVDRLIGLAGVSSHVVKSMELRKRLPLRMNPTDVEEALAKIAHIIQVMADRDIFVWLERAQPATDVEIHRAATIVADRLCGAVANPIIRNAQERRQLSTIKAWLEARGYSLVAAGDGREFVTTLPGTFAFHKNVTAMLAGSVRRVNIPIDVVVMPKKAHNQDYPILLEAKSAGDFTNTNKRRKEEAMKMSLLRANYGEKIPFILFLCGYFDTGYLGYEAAEGIDWVWEHRVDDLALFGL
jgi:type II restriction enzyme